MIGTLIGSLALAILDMWITRDGKKLGLSEERKLLVWKYGPRTGAAVQCIVALGLFALMRAGLVLAGLMQFLFWAAQAIVVVRNLLTLRRRRKQLQEEAKKRP